MLKLTLKIILFQTKLPIHPMSIILWRMLALSQHLKRWLNIIPDLVSNHFFLPSPFGLLDSTCPLWGYLNKMIGLIGVVSLLAHRLLLAGSESSPNPLHYALFNYSDFGRGTALLNLVVKIIILSQVFFSSWVVWLNFFFFFYFLLQLAFFTNAFHFISIIFLWRVQCTG